MCKQQPPRLIICEAYLIFAEAYWLIMYCYLYGRTRASKLPQRQHPRAPPPQRRKSQPLRLEHLLFVRTANVHLPHSSYALQHGGANGGNERKGREGPGRNREGQSVKFGYGLMGFSVCNRNVVQIHR